MFGTLGGPEVLLLLVLALIVFGPRKLPEIGKSMGRMLAEFRKASNDFKRTLEKMRSAFAEEPAAATPPAPEAAVPAAASEEAADGNAPPPAESALAAPTTAPPDLHPPDESVSRG
jgi:TatA/E family protein of Tat protein translocase